MSRVLFTLLGSRCSVRVHVRIRFDSWSSNLNTCHVWAEDGEVVRTIEAGGEFETPIPIARRAVELGVGPDDDRLRFRR